MISIERTSDVELLRAFLAKPSQFPKLAPHAEKVAVHQLFVACDAGHPVAMFILIEHNDVLADVHMIIPESIWGPVGVAIAKVFRDWVWQNTNYCRIVGNVAAHNKLAIRFAEKVGLVKFGVNEKSMIKDGQVVDVVMLGITRGKQ